MIRLRRRHVLRAAASATAVALAGCAPWPAYGQTEERFGPATWMRIPRIDVDSRVTDVGVTNGFYDVPWFDVGHHNDSHNPGDLGNSIFNGHVVTINAGQVFRRLDELQQGDAVYIYTPEYRVDWVVTDAFPVAQDDASFLADTDVPRVTLYTCTGQFNPIERNFAERLVVQGQLVDVHHRADV